MQVKFHSSSRTNLFLSKLILCSLKAKLFQKLLFTVPILAAPQMQSSRNTNTAFKLVLDSYCVQNQKKKCQSGSVNFNYTKFAWNNKHTCNDNSLQTRCDMKPQNIEKSWSNFLFLLPKHADYCRQDFIRGLKDINRRRCSPFFE